MQSVLKFGGSSLAGIDRLNNVCNIISNVLDEGEIPIVVLSAMGDTTNKLLKASELSLKNNDIIESKRIIYDVKSSHYKVLHYVLNCTNSSCVFYAISSVVLFPTTCSLVAYFFLWN